MSVFASPSKMRSSTTGGGSTGRRSAEAIFELLTFFYLPIDFNDNSW